MPSHDFSNIGDVLDFDILRGTITSVDSETDTCEVSVDGTTYEALLFYHCEPDSEIRSNGAIEGAASGFDVDDEVIVMIKKDQDVIKVIAHVDGIKKCGKPCAEFVMGTIVVVWDLANNCPYEIDGVTFPCRSDLPAYAEWRSARRTEDSASSLFSLTTHCGNPAGSGLLTVGCSTLCGIADEWESSDTISHIGSCPFWDSYAGALTVHGITNSCIKASLNNDPTTYTDVFYTAFGINQLPGISLKPGVRSFYQLDSVNTLNMPTGDDVDPSADWGDDVSTTEVWKYYGILKDELMYGFTGGRTEHGWSSSSYGRPYYGAINRLSAFTPHAGRSSSSVKRFEPPRAVGMYSDNAIVFLTILQACPVTRVYGDNNGSYVEGGAYDEYSYSGRRVKMQAVANYYEETEGSYGRDYTAFAKNAALSSLLEDAVDMLYADVLELDGNEVVKIIPEINILK